MQVEVKKHLFDIREAISPIEQYTDGLDGSRFLKNGMIQAAVERKFEIIGEAFNRIQRINPPAIKHISEYDRIVAFRNILAHGYDVIDHEIVWDIIKNHLPGLKAEVERLLES